MAIDIQTLASNFGRLGISEFGRVLTNIEAQSFLMEHIKEKQLEDDNFFLIQNKVLKGEVEDDILD